MIKRVLPILLFCAMTLRGSEPGRLPTDTRPSRVAAPLPETFHVLLSRSIFSRGKSASAQAGVSAIGMALRGVVSRDGAFTAIVEDVSTHRIENVSEGLTLAGGRISHITLRGFDYELRGNVIAVAIGHDLKGESATAPTTAPSDPALAEGAAPTDAAVPSPDDANAAVKAMEAAVKLNAAAHSLSLNHRATVARQGITAKN